MHVVVFEDDGTYLCHFLQYFTVCIIQSMYFLRVPDFLLLQLLFQLYREACSPSEVGHDPEKQETKVRRVLPHPELWMDDGCSPALIWSFFAILLSYASTLWLSSKQLFLASSSCLFSCVFSSCASLFSVRVDIAPTPGANTKVGGKDDPNLRTNLRSRGFGTNWGTNLGHVAHAAH